MILNVIQRFWICLKVRYRWIYFAILIIFVFEVGVLQFLELVDPSSDNSIQNNQYVLIAISQGLAALFALIFAISRLVYDTGHKYRGLIEEFFLIRFNWVFPVVNAFGIICPDVR